MRGVPAISALGCAALAWLSPILVAAPLESAALGDVALASTAGEALVEPASLALRAAAWLVLVAGAIASFAWLRRGRAAVRQSAPPPGEIDAEWLERHLFSFTPELVGALYDRRVDWPEVAALVARMSGESKLAGRVATGSQGFGNLELWLLVDREELTGYERELIEGLFRAERTTSGEAVQEAYRAVGFDPAAILRRHLEPSCDSLLGKGPILTAPLWLALAAAALASVAAVWLGAARAAPAALAAGLAALGAVSARQLAARWGREPGRESAETRAMLTGSVAHVVTVGALLALWPSLSPVEVGLFFAGSLLASVVGARSLAPRESARGLDLRRSLLAARQFFAAELERSEPRIRDEWLPYLIALDLKGAVDHWFLAHGRLDTAARRQRLTPSQGEPLSSAAESERSWTGGAGAYGGTGASGAWVAATCSLTVLAPGRRRAPLGALGYS